MEMNNLPILDRPAKLSLHAGAKITACRDFRMVQFREEGQMKKKTVRYMWMNPRGRLWGDTSERQRDLNDPYVPDLGASEYPEYLRRLQKLGWKIVKVEVRELKAK